MSRAEGGGPYELVEISVFHICLQFDYRTVTVEFQTVR